MLNYYPQQVYNMQTTKRFLSGLAPDDFLLCIENMPNDIVYAYPVLGDERANWTNPKRPKIILADEIDFADNGIMLRKNKSTFPLNDIKGFYHFNAKTGELLHSDLHQDTDPPVTARDIVNALKIEPFEKQIADNAQLKSRLKELTHFKKKSEQRVLDYIKQHHETLVPRFLSHSLDAKQAYALRQN